MSGLFLNQELLEALESPGSADLFNLAGRWWEASQQADGSLRAGAFPRVAPDTTLGCR